MKWRILLLLTLVGTSAVSRADYYTFTRIDFPTSAAPMGINNAGDIVGGIAILRGFLYSHGTLSTFAVPGSVSTDPQGINNVGQIVGFSTLTVPDGTVYSDGAFIPWIFPGADALFGTWLTSINDIGQILGLYATGPVAPDRELLVQCGSFIPISSPGGMTLASGINNNSQIVGTYFTDIYHGYLRQPDGTLTTIDLPG